MAEVEIIPGQPWDGSKLSEAQKADLGIGVKEGFEAINKCAANIGKNINGWQVGAAQGDRTFIRVTICQLALRFVK
jgi:hypothetical protein